MGDITAVDTISSLEMQGYTVVVQNPGNVALEEATAVGVRQGPEQVMRVREQEHENLWIETITQSIVFVDVR